MLFHPFLTPPPPIIPCVFKSSSDVFNDKLWERKKSIQCVLACTVWQFYFILFLALFNCSLCFLHSSTCVFTLISFKDVSKVSLIATLVRIMYNPFLHSQTFIFKSSMKNARHSWPSGTVFSALLNFNLLLDKKQLPRLFFFSGWCTSS